MTMATRKITRDGATAVLLSPEYGAGWSTWNADRYPLADLVFCPAIVEARETGASKDTLAEIARGCFPDAYLGGLRDIEVVWVPEGTPFVITEYDGYESISCNDEIGLLTA